MNVSLDRTNKAFEGLTFKQVRIFLAVLQQRHIKDYSIIESIFSEESHNFNNTINFLCRIGILKKQENLLSLNIDISTQDSVNFKNILLNWIIKSRNNYRSEIFQFIKCFKVVESQVSYSSPDHKRSGESAVRNFLIELGIIHYESETNRYILSDGHINLFAYAYDNATSISPSFMLDINNANEEIGYAAEKRIIEYEKYRVGKKLAHHVKHIAETNVAAGYDIHSMTINNDLSTTPRLIEVKAVPKQSYLYYWSRNEIDVSKILGDWYYLYLLPVAKNGDFNIEKLLIVRDPYKHVLETTSDWLYEPDVLKCYLRESKKPNR